MEYGRGDPNKDAINKRRHGYSFSTGKIAFEGDPNFEWREDYVDNDGERRYQGFGLLPNLQLLMIAFVIRSNSEGREYLWPISVRDATDYEEDHYYGR